MLGKILGINQEVSFEDGSITNFVSIQLENGFVFKALITDETTAGLMQSLRGGAPAPQAAPPPPYQPPADPTYAVMQPPPPPPQRTMPVETSSGREEEAVVFGGDDDIENEGTYFPGPDGASVDAPPVPMTAPDPDLASSDPQIQAAAYRRQQELQKKRARNGPTIGRTVPKDEYGYPITRGNGVDARDVVGGGTNIDEDGVGQL